MRPHRPMAVDTITIIASMAAIISPGRPMEAVATTRTVWHAMEAPLVSPMRDNCRRRSNSCNPDWNWTIVVGAKNVISLAPSRNGLAAPRHVPYRLISPITTINHNQPIQQHQPQQQQQQQDSLEPIKEPSMVNLPVHYLSIVQLCPKAIHLVITPRPEQPHTHIPRPTAPHTHTHTRIHITLFFLNLYLIFQIL